MGFFSTLFTGAATIVVGIILGLLIVIAAGFVIYGLVKLRDRNKYK